MPLVQGQIFGFGFLNCVRFARYCGKKYRRHLFSYDGLLRDEIALLEDRG